MSLASLPDSFITDGMRQTLKDDGSSSNCSLSSLFNDVVKQAPLDTSADSVGSDCPESGSTKKKIGHNRHLRITHLSEQFPGGPGSIVSAYSADTGTSHSGIRVRTPPKHRIRTAVDVHFWLSSGNNRGRGVRTSLKGGDKSEERKFSVVYQK